MEITVPPHTLIHTQANKHLVTTITLSYIAKLIFQISKTNQFHSHVTPQLTLQPSILISPHTNTHKHKTKTRPTVSLISSNKVWGMASTSCFLHHHAAISSPPAARTSSQRYVPSLKATQVVCRAQKQDAADVDSASMSRRLALTVLIGAGAAAVGSKVSPADAAYGESANIFGKPKTNTEFKPYAGDGFQLSVPAKWNPSNEVEFPGQVLRYEDNFDATSNLSVMITPTDKKSITDFGAPEDFLSKVDYLLGKQAYFGKTDSEGGFDSGAVATANILETATPVVGGAQYYFVSVLTRTADGDEGGKHQLISATVKDGKLYICKAQAGDKRWFKGAKKFVENAATSFSVA